MNQQLIERLAEQANFKKDKFVVGYWDMPECQKFAELIVRECCQVLEQTQTALDRHKWPTPSECGVYIKEHFGVEE